MTFTFSFYAADKDVLQDHEIQGFANEMSAQGLGSNGGKGKVRINSVICHLPFFPDLSFYCIRSELEQPLKYELVLGFVHSKLTGFSRKKVFFFEEVLENLLKKTVPENAINTRTILG